MDIEKLKSWLGREQRAAQRMDLWPVEGLHALLNMDAHPAEGDEAPYLAQWLYFGPTVPQSRIATDGHPERGDFLPPIPLPRRMWAASDVTFKRNLRIGETVQKTARIADISSKEGASGTLLFLKVDNDYVDESGAAILRETQTLVYRDEPSSAEASPRSTPAPSIAAWSQAVTPDETMLFRYSAITFNAHRIHYDRSYTQDVEHYADIIVQGQLTATLLLEAFLRAKPEQRIASFSFRGVQPIFCNETIYLEGAPDGSEGTYRLWARDAAGNMRTSAKITVV